MKWQTAFILPFFLPLFVLGQNRKAENWGGKKELKRIFVQELYYAPNSLEKNYGGKVKLGFDLTEEGKIENIEVMRSVSRELNAEAVRLLKLLMWNPAMSDGKPMATSESISFKFNPVRYDALCDSRGYRTQRPPENFIFKVYDESDLTAKPKFSGPGKSYKHYIATNLKYPSEAIKTGAEGLVEIQFIIEPTGRLTNVHVSQSLEANCDIAARKLILDTKWQPGSKNGIAVRTLMTRQYFFSPGAGNKEFYLPGD
jgi:TonB family protein